MIDSFETDVRIDPDGVFFTYTDRNGNRFSYSYYESRIIAAALARRLMASGLRAGDVVMVDLPNCPELVFVILACAYGGFPIGLIDHRLPASEKISRRLEIQRSRKNIGFEIDYVAARRMLSPVREKVADPSDYVRGIHGRARPGRSIMGESQDLIDETVHFAERSAHLFDASSLALIAFSNNATTIDQSDTRTNIRAVPLTWEMLYGAAGSLVPNDSVDISRSISGRVSRKSNSPHWQCAMPLYRIGGFQTLVMSIEARTHLRLYTGLDPEQMLHDAEYGHGDHIIVDEPVLQEMLTVEEWRSEMMAYSTSRLSLYKRILLVWQDGLGHTLRRAWELGANVYVGYGMPESSGCMAVSAAAGPHGCEGLVPLEGCGVHVIDPDGDGRGRLAISGPGIFDGYLNANTPFTIDHFFITNDFATVDGGLIHIENRSKDKFTSAGQDIFPVEVANVLRHVPGVSAVHVFGVPDARCGMLPVAALEREDRALTSEYVADITRHWFTDFTVPISLFVFDDLPRNERGKLDREAIESFFAA